MHCSRKHMGKAEEDRLAGCVGLPASRLPPDIIAPGGNGRPGPTRPLTAADKFLTSCPAFQPPFVPAIPPPPWHDSWQTCILCLTGTGTAEAMLTVTSPSTSKGAGWHRVLLPVPPICRPPLPCPL